MRRRRMAAAAGLAAWSAACASAPATAGDAPSPRPEASESVVLLHGLGRTHRSMTALEAALEAEGYRVVNVAYPSRSHPIEELADTVAHRLDACCAEDERIHFVTHSLGGILVRLYAESAGPERIGRVVMLSPPNRGSELVDRLPDWLLRLSMGPGALQLGTGTGSVVHDLDPVEFELGILAGDGSLNPLFSALIPGADDGKVSVASARAEGAADFRVVPYSHAFIMRRSAVIREVVHFLAAGEFTTSTDRAPRDDGGTGGVRR